MRLLISDLDDTSEDSRSAPFKISDAPLYDFDAKVSRESLMESIEAAIICESDFGISQSPSAGANPETFIKIEEIGAEKAFAKTAHARRPRAQNYDKNQNYSVREASDSR